jgi:hypothetical protein
MRKFLRCELENVAQVVGLKDLELNLLAPLKRQEWL